MKDAFGLIWIQSIGKEKKKKKGKMSVKAGGGGQVGYSVPLSVTLK